VTRLSEISAPPELVAEAVRGDRAAQGRLYASLAPGAFALVRYLIGGGTSQAEDLFQDAMMTFFERLTTYRREAPIGAWLRQIVVSRCLMYLRSPWHRARMTLEHIDLDRISIAPDPTPDAVDLERALDALAPTARAVVWLYEVEGYSHPEIAACFGRSVSFSKSQLARAHRRLRETLDPETERQPCTPT
jgi:RNA polymerase sigma factor (sigma-70 family)